MIVQCTHCPARVKIVDSAFDRGIPTVLCPICKKQFKPEYKVIPKAGKKDNPVTEKDTEIMGGKVTDVGWLVVHDEKTESQSFTLKPGKQTVGHISQIKSKQSDLMINTDDEYMSRLHFVINVEANKSGGYNYYLSDNNSLNGTYINAKPERLKKNDIYKLQDGDTIQAGETKIAFKSNKHAKSKMEAEQIVGKQPREKTVILDFMKKK